MTQFYEIQTFVSVVENAGISAAADRLGIAKSAVSRRLADLEARLGAQLLHRTTRRITLTDAGRGFYERCKRVLADLEEAEQSVAQAHGALRGLLRITMPMAFGLLHVAPAITAFMTQHPHVDFELDFNDRQVDLLQDGFDLAIRIARLSDSSLIARRLAPICFAVCASPSYIALHGAPRAPEELTHHACLIYSNAQEPGVWSYTNAKGDPVPVKVGVKLKTNNGDFLRAAAIAGQGIVMLPTFYLHDAVADGRLMTLLTDVTWPTVNAYAVYPPTRHLSTRVRAFVDFLAGRFAGTPYWDHDVTVLGRSTS